MTEPDRSYRATAARNWDESKPRILAMEQRHTSLLGLMRQQGYPEDHPGIAYHQDMIAKVQRERQHYESWGAGLTSREPRTATVEQGMENRAWKYLGKRDDDDD